MEIIIINKIEKFVVKYCSEHQCTKTDFARKLGISPQGLDNLCSSKNPKLLSLVKIATYLKCKPSDLYEYIVSNNNE